MPLTQTCPRCGTVVPYKGWEGLCPSCLVQVSLGTTATPHPNFLGVGRGEGNAPRRFGDYELLEEIARGGMGVVFKARQVSLNRIVALKMILAGEFAREAEVQRFRAEAESAAQLQHPNIVAIHEVGVQDGQHFFSMDYVEGQNLSDLVRNSPLPSKQAARYLKTIAEAIHYAHQHGILHRDLKPSNVLIDEDGEPRITDFGLAKRVECESFVTVTGQVLGSPNFMPPEQAGAKLGKAGRYSDVYALGGILYYLVTGRPPFLAETLAEILDHVLNTQAVSPRLLNPSVPQDLATICLKCLEKQPAQRYQTTQALADELARFLGNEPIHARPLSRTGKAWRWCRRNPRLATSLGALAAVFISGFLGVSWQWQQTRRENRAARLNLYVGDMNLAQQSLAAGNLGRAMQLVERHRPKPGEPDFRGFEWRYLWRLCQGDEHISLLGHSNLVWSTEFSPGGETFVTCDSSRRVKVWNAATHQLLTELDRSVSSAAFLPGGKTLVVADDQGIAFLDTTDWREQKTSWALTNCFAPIAVSTNGELLAAMSAAGVKVFDTHTWRLVRRFTNASGPLAFSPNGALLATDTPRGITLWPLDSPGSPRLLEDSAELFLPVNHWLTKAKCIAFAPNGEWLVAADNTRSFGVTVWNVSSGKIAQAIPAQHAGEVAALAFSPDGQILATASWDHSIRLWDFPARTCLSTLQAHLHEVWALSFSADGTTLVSGSKDGAVKLWDVQSQVHDKSILGLSQPIGFSRDGEALAAVSSNWMVQFHHLQTGKTIDAFAFPSNAIPKRSYLWWRCAYAASPDLDLLIARIGESKLGVWSMPSGRQIAEWNEGTNSIVDILLSPDGNTIAMSSTKNPQKPEEFNPVKVWEYSSGRVRSFGTGTPEVIDPVAFSPDGRCIATIQDLGRTIVWDLATLHQRITLRWPNSSDFVINAAFSWDGRLLAAVNLNNKAALWEVSTGRFLGEFTGHKQSVACIAFSPDNKTLVTGGNDGTIRFWNIQTRQEVLSFSRRGLHPVALIFSVDGRVFASRSESFSGDIPQFPLLRAASWSEVEMPLSEASLLRPRK